MCLRARTRSKKLLFSSLCCFVWCSIIITVIISLLYPEVSFSLSFKVLETEERFRVEHRIVIDKLIAILWMSVNQLVVWFYHRNLSVKHFYPKFTLHTYSQTRIKCSRPICSLPGLQGQKIFADAIIKILISTKSISDKNCYDQLFINKVVKIFTFQFDESVTKFYVVKVLLILMKFS